MARLTPAISPRPVIVDLPFRVSEDWLSTHLAATGVRMSERNSLSFALDEVSTELRADAMRIEARRKALDKDAALEPVVDMLDLDEPLANVPRVLAAWRSALDAWDVDADHRRVAHEIRAQEERNESAGFRKAMEEWVAMHGSQRLRLALDRGYKMSGAYVRERASSEFPGYLVDMTGDASWKERANPSEASLQKETEALDRLRELGIDHEVQIVWLIEPPKDYWDQHSEFDAGEAVVVRQYLARYDLVVLVDPPATLEDEILF